MKMSESHGDDPVEKVGAVSTNCSVVTRSMTGSTPGNRTKSIGGVGNAGNDSASSVPGHRTDAVEETGGIAPLPSWSESEGEKNDSLIPVEGSVAGELTEEDCLLCDVDVTEYLKELRELEKKVDRSDLEIANAAFVDWHVSLRKVKQVDEKKEFPFLQPASQNMMHRTLMARLRDAYDFRYTTSDFTKFNGSLGGVLASLYNQRVKIWVSENENFECLGEFIFLSY